MNLKILLLIFLLIFSSCSLSSQQMGLLDKPAPTPIYYPLDQSPRALSSDLGKIVLLAFWDADCSHCRREMPKLNALAKAFVGDENMSFIAISVNRASEEDSLKATIRELNLDAFTHAFSGNDTLDQSFQAFKGQSIPYFVLVDKLGLVRWIDTEAESMREQVIKLTSSN